MRDMILVGDDSELMGKRIANGILRSGLPAYCCKCRYEDIIHELSETKPSVFIMIIFDPDEQSLEFVSELKRQFPDTALITGIFSPQSAVHIRFLKAGAIHSFMIPLNGKRLFTDIVKVVSRRNADISPYERFLYSCGFPEALKGFRYLSAAMGICLKETSLVSGGISEIYRRIAASLHTEPASVERAMRNFSSVSEQNGSLGRLKYGRMASHPSNHELICMACDAFVIHVKEWS